MIPGSFRVVALILSVALCNVSFAPVSAQEVAIKLVEIEGLKASYCTCERVEPSVRNVSNQDIYVEVYVENFTNGSWVDDTYPYAINDPNSLYSKIVKANRIEKGAAQPLSYERCLKPKFVKEEENSFKRRIAESDKTAEDRGTPRVQRIRIEIHFSDPNAKAVRTWSRQFQRLADKKSATK